ncbi:MAG: DNA translocase FtsK [Ferruginibacter sp.]|nr:DNA translocase FtsK [Ferruginibacter sp.]
MAKKTKAKGSDKEVLKDDKVETVKVKQLIKDERTRKILGTFFLLLTVLFFVAFSSHLYTWNEDQSQISKRFTKLLWQTDIKVNNMMGTLGAFLSFLFMDYGFGIASFLFCSLFFVIGINLLVGQKYFSVVRNLKYVFVGLPLISVTASTIAEYIGAGQHYWGGAFGDMCRSWLINTVGNVGTIALILVSFFSYIIWRFNPTFKMSVRKKKEDSPTESDGVNIHSEPDEYDGDNTNKYQTGGNRLLDEKQPDAKVEGEINSSIPLVLEAVEIAEETALKENHPSIAENSDNLALEIKTAEIKKEESVNTNNSNKQKSYDPILDLRDYKYPTVDMLENHGSEKIIQDPAELENNKNQIINTLKNYDIDIQKIAATIGPTVTLYEIIPEAGVRISKIKNLEDDIALSLAALGIRIIAPIPGKGTIGIEVPNAKKTIVSMKTLLSADKFRNNNFSLPIAIGKKIDNENFIVDLANMPHLLMAGATGQGKSVGLNAILISLLYSKHPSQLKFVLVDPKKVELSIYTTIEKHFLAKLPGEEDAIITDTKKVVHTLNALCIEMDNRYDLLKEAGCRNIREYNEKFAARKLNPEKGHQFLPFIVLVVDEFADLIMTAGKEIEMPIGRLAQLARAVGIHLIIATQRPSVNIITGTIKANFPARIAFKVSSKIDSRTILDTGGAEQLIGKGDMLISYNGEVVRLQCAFVDTPEVEKIVDFIGDQRGYPQAFLLPEYMDEKDMDGKDFDVNDKDALFEDAARLIVSSQSGSTSLLQRRMKLGYNRAGRLMDQLEAAGIVGASQGSKVRDVLIKTESDLQQLLNSL